MEKIIPTIEEILDKHLYNKFDDTDRQTFLNAMKEYSEILLQSLTDEIKENAKIEICNKGKGCGLSYCDVSCQTISKQSIQTITDNFIKQLK